MFPHECEDYQNQSLFSPSLEARGVGRVNGGRETSGTKLYIVVHRRLSL